MPEPSEHSRRAASSQGADDRGPRWLVDGLNVIGARPDGWWRDRRGAMRSLAAKLARFAGATGDDVSVVFDGRPFDLDGAAGAVTVRFGSTPGPGAADDEIVRLIEAIDDPSAVRLVTSDAQLADRARKLGASVVGASGFRRRLDAL